MGIPIKPKTGSNRPVNIAEWNPDVRAFVKDLSITEEIRCRDSVSVYWDQTKTPEQRADAAISVCILALVDEAGRPILTPDQTGDLMKAATDPVIRVLAMVLNRTMRDETLTV